MKLIDTLLGILGWLVFGLILWAILPILQKLLEVCQGLHGLWN